MRKQSFIISKIIIGFSTFRKSQCKKPIMKGWMGCFECCNYRCLQQCQLLSSFFPFFRNHDVFIDYANNGDQDINILWQVLYHFVGFRNCFIGFFFFVLFFVLFFFYLRRDLRFYWRASVWLILKNVFCFWMIFLVRNVR